MTKDIRSEGVEKMAEIIIEQMSCHPHRNWMWEYSQRDNLEKIREENLAHLKSIATLLWDNGIRDRSGFIYCLATKMIKPAYYKTGGS